jgi:acyl carrier protein
MLDRADIQKKVIENLHAVEPSLAETHISEATRLADLRMDSLRLVELGVLLEDAFGDSVRFDDWLERERQGGDEAYSLESLIDFIAEALAG